MSVFYKLSPEVSFVSETSDISEGLFSPFPLHHFPLSYKTFHSIMIYKINDKMTSSSNLSPLTY